MKPFYVYILECADGSYYVGHTDDLGKRMALHEEGSCAGYTAQRRPVRLVFADEFPSRDDAIQRERQLKGWTRAKKRALIRGDWEAVHQLAGCRSARGPSQDRAK